MYRSVGKLLRSLTMILRDRSFVWAMVRAALGPYVLGAHPNAVSAWLRVPDYWQAERIVRELRTRKIAVTSPDPFLVGGTERPNAVRVCIGAETTDAACNAALETIAGVFEQYPHLNDFH